MKLKKYLGPAILIFMLVSFTNAFAEKPEEKNKPEAYFPEQSFTFDRVLEGSQVTHDFVIKNKGNGPLAVERVKSS
jgi:hypothetical protein